MKRLENKHIWLALDTSDFFKGGTVIRGGAQNHLCPMISLPYTFFLLNGDMELNKNRQIFVNKML
jgi:hypothetical protein